MKSVTEKVAQKRSGPQKTLLREEVADTRSIWLGQYVAERRDCSEKQIAQSRSS